MSDPVVVLYLARHGQTVLNASGKFRGNANPSLDEKGFTQAATLASLFRNIPLSFIVSSDKLRAQQTANAIGAEKKVKVHSTPSLRAFNIGEFSGKDRSPENVEKLEEFINNPDIVIPGGESLNQFKSRIDPAIIEAMDISDENGTPGLLVAHSSIVHECSNMVYGDHKKCLVEPGGAAALFVKNGKLGMEAIYRPVIPPPSGKHDTIS